jgi:LCP family protein required for cell wall assembly
MDEPENKIQIDLPPLERSRQGGELSLLNVALIILLFVICGLVGFFAGKLYGTNLIPDGAPYADLLPEDDAGEQSAERRILTVLIIGVDQRYKNEPSRSDILILGCFNLDSKAVSLVSIPRDTRTLIAEKNVTRKINYAHTVGGPELSKSTVQNLLDVPVDYYVETNFKGFENCIDILGGVSLDVERKMYYPEEDIDLKAGQQTLNGYDALAYCRWRGDGMGDIGRIERQHKFLRALMDQSFKWATLPKLPKLIAEVSQNIVTDMNLTQITKLARALIPTGDLTLNAYMIPGEEDAVHYGGSYWIVNEAETQALMDSIFHPQTASATNMAPDDEAGGRRSLEDASALKNTGG